MSSSERLLFTWQSAVRLDGAFLWSGKVSAKVGQMFT